MKLNLFLRIIKNILPYYLVKNGRKILHGRKSPFDAWFADQGDETLRLEYEAIDENAIVFDIGGYKGQWASDIFSKYCCSIYIFEPVKEFAEKIEKRYAKNSKIVCFPFGFGNKNIKTEFSVLADSSSLYKNKDIKVEVDLVNIMDFLYDKKIEHIDLMKINIEGGEYDLLDCLIESDYIKKIDNLQIQFHAFFPDAVVRRKKIQDELAETHRITYNYEFVWENWERIIDNIISMPPPPHQRNNFYYYTIYIKYINITILSVLYRQRKCRNV